jgi:diguanylate cyclase (GGDEF)-like protein/PAS domain S-box-containing protein
LGFLLTVAIAVLAIGVIFFEMRAEAVRAAEEEAQIILRHNLAIHAYLNQQLKPAFMAAGKMDIPEGYFDPTWMYSTYAVREIDRIFRSSGGMENYYYKEAAIDARSPQNEADAAERAFLQALNHDPELSRQVTTRMINGKPFLEVMVRGETISTGCLACHSTPDRAPRQLIEYYGSQRGFDHSVGEVVSAVSIRVPLAAAFQSTNWVAGRTAFILGVLMLGMASWMRFVVERWLVRPLEQVRVEALHIAAGERPLGEQIPIPTGFELADLTTAFNRLSMSLYQSRTGLEEQIEERTRELRQSRNLVQKVLDMTPSGLCLYNTHEDLFVFVNQQDLAFFGVSEEEFLASGKDFALAKIHPEDQALYHAMRVNLGEGNDTAEVQLRAINACGEWRWVKFRAQVVERDEAHLPLLILYYTEDITQQHEAAERLRYTSTHDALTGLYNWAYFEEALAKTCYSDAFPASIIIMDVDNLKQINDSVGHIAGDELLRRIGGMLATVFRTDDTVARLGGDEFAALLPKVDEANARQVIKRLRARLAEATQVAGIRLDVLSIGLHTAQNPEDLQRARHSADQDMYREKQSRKNSR